LIILILAGHIWQIATLKPFCFFAPKTPFSKSPNYPISFLIAIPHKKYFIILQNIFDNKLKERIKFKSSKKAKPVARRGRKATGLITNDKTAGLPG
jgi:hypothetical protein